MNIREALPEDNDELQELQAKCPQGTTLVASNVNTPDFFARKGVKSRLDPFYLVSDIYKHSDHANDALSI